MKQQDTLFVTITVKDQSGRRVAEIKNAKYGAGMARIKRMIDSKYQPDLATMPPLIRSMISGDVQ